MALKPIDVGVNQRIDDFQKTEMYKLLESKKETKSKLACS